jgi:hypothetical protein
MANKKFGFMFENRNSKFGVKNQNFELKFLKSVKSIEIPQSAESINSTINLQSRNTSQIIDPKCLGADFNIAKSVLHFVIKKPVDETIMRIQASIGMFCLFVKTISDKNECGNGIHELMLCFNSDAFLKFNKKMQRVA